MPVMYTPTYPPGVVSPCFRQWQDNNFSPDHNATTVIIAHRVTFSVNSVVHDDVIKWKKFPRYWPFVRGIHLSPVNSPHKGQWRGALVFSLFCVWINGWVNNREAGDLRRYRAHYDVIVMISSIFIHRSLCRLLFHLAVWEMFAMEYWAPSQYKDHLAQVLGFPC